MIHHLPKKIHNYLIYGCFLCCGATVWGQNRVVPPPQLGLGLSVGSYLGDLNPQLNAADGFTPGLDMSLQFPGKALGPEIHAGLGQIVAQLPPGTQAVMPVNTFVATDLFYLDLRMRLQLLRRFRLNPVLAGGVGVLVFSPKDYTGAALTDLPATRANGEMYSGSSLSFPVSAGLRYRFNNRFSIGAEAITRWTKSDYLDNISQWGNATGNDRVVSLVLSAFIRLEDPSLYRMEQQIEHQVDTNVVANLPIVPKVEGKSGENQLVMLAINNHQYVYCRMRKGDDPDSLAIKLKIDAKILRNINYLPPTGGLTTSFNLKVPNIWYTGVKKPFSPEIISQKMAEKQYMYCIAGSAETFAALSVRYGIPEKIIRELNYLPQGEPESGSLVRLLLLPAPDAPTFSGK